MCYLVSWLLQWPDRKYRGGECFVVDTETKTTKYIRMLSMDILLFIFSFSLSLFCCTVSPFALAEWFAHLFKRCGQKSIKWSLLVFLTFVVFSITFILLALCLSLPLFSSREKKWYILSDRGRWYCNFAFITFYCFCFLPKIFYFVAHAHIDAGKKIIIKLI